MTNRVFHLLWSGLVLTLLAVFCISLFGETIPYNDGAGFDGEFYRNVFQNFSTDFFTTGYDPFRIQRIFPFCLLNLIYGGLSIPRTHQNMLYGMEAIHLVNLALQLFCFFQMKRTMHWKEASSLVLFAVLFLNYFTLKNCGYEPFQTDAFAVTIALASYVLFLRGRLKLSWAVALLGLATWPVITAVAAVILLFGTRRSPSNTTTPGCTIPTGTEYTIPTETSTSGCSHSAVPFPTGNPFQRLLHRPLPSKWLPALPYLYAAAAAGIVALLYATRKTDLLQSLLMMRPHPLNLALSLAAMTLFLRQLLKDCPLPPFTLGTVRPGFHLRRLPWIFVPALLVWAYLKFHANDNFFFDSKFFALQILVRPLKYPLVTWVGHFVYWGILPILVYLLFPSLFRNFTKKSPAHVIVMFLFLFFALDSEGRHVATFIPLLLPALGATLDERSLSLRTSLALVLLQLILSHFYLPINAEGFTQALENYDFGRFPAQWYFMNFGPWISLQSYAALLILSFLSLFSAKILLKR